MKPDVTSHINSCNVVHNMTCVRVLGVLPH